MSKEVKPDNFYPLSRLCVVNLFRFYYFRRFRHSERGIKSLMWLKVKIEGNMYRCADEKISKAENIVTVANRDVENLDHQS